MSKSKTETTPEKQTATQVISLDTLRAKPDIQNVITYFQAQIDALKTGK